MTDSYPRESVEFHGICLQRMVNGQMTSVSGDDPIWADTTAQVTLSKQRPISDGWLPLVELDGEHGLLVGGRQAGLCRIWVRISGTPETPVIDCGTFEVS